MWVIILIDHSHLRILLLHSSNKWFYIYLHSFQTTTATAVWIFLSWIPQLWATKKNLGKRLEDIPLPSREIKNVLEEIHFKDELTRSRCRGWLSLPFKRYMRADILFPGCDFDCRLTITGHNGMLLSSKVKCSMFSLMYSTLFTICLRYATSVCKIKTSLQFFFVVYSN